jgi:predicted dehydrogenase
MQLTWGIIGTSLIAYEVSYAIKYVKNNLILAVTSSKRENAAQFAKILGLPRFYDNLEYLLGDTEINIIYVATPTYLHFEIIKKCLKNGKHVLCEKPICMNSHEANEIKSLALKRNLFCMEANWVVFNPAIQKLSSYVKSGKIGEIRHITGSFGHVINEHVNEIRNQGVLLNLGVYLIAICIDLLGRPDMVLGTEGNTKGISSFIMLYNKYTTASFTCSHISNLKNEITVAGTKGIITVKSPFYRSGYVEFEQFSNNSNKLLSLVEGKMIYRNYYNYPFFLKYTPFLKRIYKKLTNRSLITPFLGSSYHYQIQEIVDSISHGFIESARHPIENSITALEVIEKLKNINNQK